jgi:AcrR family transcriptional regulator
MATSKPDGSYHHGGLREALVKTALLEVERAGATAVSLAGLAKSLGVTQSAPYRHFPDREALMVAVATEGFLQFTASLAEARQQAPKTGALIAMAMSYVTFGRDRAHLYAAMFASQLLPKAMTGSNLQATASASFDLLVQAVDDAGAAEPRQRALEIWVGLHGVVMLSNEGLLAGRIAAIDIEDLVNRLVRQAGAPGDADAKLAASA